jgi:hypothetical protein
MNNGRLPTVTVVIPTGGGRARMIDRMLPVLLADPATTEVIIAFDRDEPETRQVVDSYSRSDDRVRRIQTASAEAPTGNRGQSAREAAVRVAEGELVLALDDDLEPEPGLVSGHARRHAGAEAESAVVGYAPVALDDRRTGAAARLFAEAYERDCARFLADDRSILTGLWGGHLSLSRTRWMEMGNPAVGLDYHDDREFGLRLLKAGVQGKFDRGLRAVHRYQRSRAELLRDAQSSGRAQARLHAAYPEFVQSPQRALDAARASGRPFVWLSRSAIGWHVITGFLLRTAEAFGAIGLSSADYVVTKLLWRVGFARGVREEGWAVMRAQPSP